MWQVLFCVGPRASALFPVGYMMASRRCNTRLRLRYCRFLSTSRNLRPQNLSSDRIYVMKRKSLSLPVLNLRRMFCSLSGHLLVPLRVTHVLLLLERELLERKSYPTNYTNPSTIGFSS